MIKKSVTLMGMSGVGKTTLSNKLSSDKWFHYSGDYRIASHYLRGVLEDFLKTEAMKSPLLSKLLKNNSIYIGSNLSINDIALVSCYIGKLGNSDLDGLDLNNFLKRQRQYYKAEIATCYDVGYFKQRAEKLYNSEYFIYDASGSICELDDDRVISYIAKETEFIYIQADDDLVETIIKRALDHPKPMYYNPEFLIKHLDIYKNKNELTDINSIIPDNFISFIIPKLMHHRHLRYLSIAKRYGKIIAANELANVGDDKDFLELLENI